MSRPKTTLKVLVLARAKVAQVWTDKTLAEDAVGYSVSSRGQAAVRWSIAGAMYAVTQPREVDLREDACWALVQAAGLAREGFAFWAIGRWENGQTQAKVLALFDRAIAACEAL